MQVRIRYMYEPVGSFLRINQVVLSLCRDGAARQTLSYKTGREEGGRVAAHP